MKAPALRRKNSSAIERLVPARFEYLFGHRPVLWFEDGSHYDQLLSDTIVEFKPETLIEYHWVKDMTDTKWEIFRLRRLKAAAIEAEMPEAAGIYLGASFRRLGMQVEGTEGLKLLVRSATKGISNSQARLRTLLEASNISHDELLYKTYAIALDTIGAVDSKLTKAEQRYDDLVKKFEQRRQILAAMKKSQVLNDSHGDVIDVGSTESNPPKRSQS